MSGKAGVGKDYIIQNVFAPRHYAQVSFAWHFKIWIVSTGQATYDEVFHTKPPHIRHLLQQEGTERGRKVYGDNIWVDTLFNWIKLWSESGTVVGSDGVSRFIIGDVRFRNEAKRLEEYGGKLIRISSNRLSRLTSEQQQHISETDLDNYYFKYHITNNIGTSTSNLEEQLHKQGIV